MSKINIKIPASISIDKWFTEKQKRKWMLTVNNGSVTVSVTFGNKKFLTLIDAMEYITHKVNLGWCLEQTPIDKSDCKITLGRVTDKNYAKEFPDQEYWFQVTDQVDTVCINLSEETFRDVKKHLSTTYFRD